MARAPRRAVRLRLHQDRQSISREGAGEHGSLCRSHFGVVRKAAGGVHLFGNNSAGPGRVARGNRRGDDGNQDRITSGTGTCRKLTKPKPASARSGKPKAASRPQPPLVRSWLSESAASRRPEVHVSESRAPPGDVYGSPTLESDLVDPYLPSCLER